MATNGFVDAVVAVTGTSKGLGAYVARKFLDEGARVFGCGIEAGSDIVDERYEYQTADVTQEADVVRWIRGIAAQAGKIDVLINNAGVASMNHSLLMPAETAAKLLMVNALGTFLCSRECAKIMQRDKYGRIVNYSSVAVPLALEGEAMYAAAKSAVETFTKIFAREVAPLGITCNAIGPAPIPTDLIRNVPKDRIDTLVQRMAVKRLGAKEDLWPVLRFFCAPDSGYVTGQILYLGGVTA